MADKELRPCPFCACSVCSVISLENEDFTVMCSECSAYGPTAETKKDAATLWNKRPLGEIY